MAWFVGWIPMLRYHLWTTEGCVDVPPELHVMVADETMRAYCMTGGGHPELWAVVAERPISSGEAASELRLLKRRLAPHLPSRLSNPDLARVGSWCLPLAQVSVSQSDVVAVGDAVRLHDVATGRGLERALTTAAAAAYAIHPRASPHATAVDANASSNP